MHSRKTNNHTWRKIKSALASAIAFISAILVIAPLGLVFFHLLINGITSVNWDFFTKLPAPVGEVGGGELGVVVELGDGLVVDVGEGCSVTGRGCTVDGGGATAMTSGTTLAPLA